MKIDLLISTWATDRDAEYMARQAACLASWHNLAHRICLVNKRQDVGHIPFVETVEPLAEHPNLAQIISVAKKGRGLYDHNTIGIINADIEFAGSLDPLDQYVRKRQVGRAFAATSQRIEDGEEYKWAYDLFIATKKVWNEVRDVPDYLRMGEPMWDVWVNQKFKLHVGGHRYLDLTPLKLINHAPHEKGGRVFDVGMDTIPVAGWVAPETKINP